ncbi:MAG TPA: DUF5666 domain-containing protein [Candidatus Angelobacter sp.]
MKRSPFALILLVVLAAALAWSQSNSAEPQPASGAPKTPSGNPQAPGTATPPAPQTAPPAQPPASTPQQSVTPPSQSMATTPQQQPAVPVSPSSSEPEQPKTEVFDSSATSSGLTTDGHDPVLDPPPLPSGKATLVGGIVTSVDHIHNRMTVKIFGNGGRWKVAFDERTHIFRNGAETTQLAIKKGERVYVDTMLDRKKHEVFARNVRLGIQAPSADADGQVTEVDSGRSVVTLRDQINSSPIHFSVDPQTKIVYGNGPASFNDLKPGCIVHVRFSPEQSNRGLAREITIVAAPGAEFTYIGKITYLDMHRGTLALEDSLDHKNYEVHFDPAHAGARDSLAIGTEVRIVAVFEGARYTAQSITVTRTAAAAENQ